MIRTPTIKLGKAFFEKPNIYPDLTVRLGWVDPKLAPQFIQALVFPEFSAPHFAQ